MFFILQVLLFPIRFIQFFYYQIFQVFKKGDHIFLEIPNEFASAEKSALASFFSSNSTEEIFFSFLNDLELITKSDRVKKVSFLIEDELNIGFAELYQIASAIKKIKSKGIYTIGFSSRGGLKNLYLMSFLDERYSSSSGEFIVLLPSIETYFFGNALKRLGVDVTGYSSGAYKSYAETFTKAGFSKEAKENLSALIRSIRTQILETFYENTKLESTILKKPFLSSIELKEKKFFKDLIIEEDFTKNYTYPKFNSKEKEETEELSFSTLKFYQNKKNFSFFQKKKKQILILPLSGTIGNGEKTSEELKSDSIDAFPLIKLLREIKENKSIAGVILEIDSGGGSASASEMIYQEILKLRETKKVYAYFQNISASGGYYIAAACDKIFSTPLTITGSIGTVMVRGNLKSFYNRFGITKDRIEFYPYRDVFSEYGSLSSESEALLRQEISRVNAMFYDRVIKARKKTPRELSKLAEGRVFSGKSFYASNMVDANITIMETLEEIKKDLDLKIISVFYKVPQYTIKTMIKENLKMFNQMIQFGKLLKSQMSLGKVNLENREVNHMIEQWKKL